MPFNASGFPDVDFKSYYQRFALPFFKRCECIDLLGLMDNYAWTLTLEFGPEKTLLRQNADRSVQADTGERPSSVFHYQRDTRFG